MTNFNRCDRLYDKAYYAQNRLTKPLPQGTRNLVGFLLARAPSVQEVLKPSERAAFAYPARASNSGLTAFHKRAVSLEGLIPGNPGERPFFISGITIKGGDFMKSPLPIYWLTSIDWQEVFTCVFFCTLIDFGAHFLVKKIKHKR